MECYQKMGLFYVGYFNNSYLESITYALIIYGEQREAKAVIEEETLVIHISQERGIMGHFGCMGNTVFLPWFIRVTEWSCLMLMFCEIKSNRKTTRPSYKCQPAPDSQELFSFLFLMSFIQQTLIKYLIHICPNMVSMYSITSAFKKRIEV